MDTMIQASILFHPKNDDYLSLACYHGGKFARLPMGDFSHVSLHIGRQVYELTWEGVALYKDGHIPRLVWSSIPFLMSFDAWQLASERLMALIRANVKLDWADLIRMVGRRKVKGLLCTDFIEVVLGTDPSHLTPLELHGKYQYLYGQVIWHNLSDMSPVPSVVAEIT